MRCCLADAHLRFKQQVQDADAGGIPKDLEQFRQVEEGSFLRHLRLHPAHHLLVEVHIAAAGGCVLADGEEVRSSVLRVPFSQLIQPLLQTGNFASGISASTRRTTSSWRCI